jgi:hypothetical protein
MRAAIAVACCVGQQRPPVGLGSSTGDHGAREDSLGTSAGAERVESCQRVGERIASRSVLGDHRPADFYPRNFVRASVDPDAWS